MELSLPMEPLLVEANPKVEEAGNQVAVMRGPVVYALESTDLPPGLAPSEVAVPASAKLTARFVPDLLGGVTVVETEARKIDRGNWEGQLYRPLRSQSVETVPIRLIPYFAWNNRGLPYMRVWLPLVR